MPVKVGTEKMIHWRSRELGFELDLPESWPSPLASGDDCLRFARGPLESLNLIVGPLQPERLPGYTEFEFRQYAHRKGYTGLEFGRLQAGGKSHVWARYRMDNGAWTKKYLLVFGGLEYAVTASCYDQLVLGEREAVWDMVVGSFCLSRWRQEEVEGIQARRREVAGGLFEKAYETAAQGLYAEARSLLEAFLDQDPGHVLAHKELAFVLKMMGDVKGSLPHRLEVKRLDPADRVNRFNLAGLYAMLGSKEAALREMDELLAMDPDNPRFIQFRKVLAGYPAG